MLKRQDQRSGDNSSNIQAQGDVNLYGISVPEVKELMQETVRATVMGVFCDNFLKLERAKKECLQEIKTRSQTFIDDLIKLTENINVNLIESLKNPFVVSSIYEAQKKYAIKGDEDLKNILLEIIKK